MAGAGAQRNRLSDTFIKNSTSNRVLLPQKQIGHRGSGCDRVIELRERTCTVAHAGRHVDQNAAAKIRVLLVLLHIEPVLLRPDFPIDASQVVTGCVLAMLEELDGLTEI